MFVFFGVLVIFATEIMGHSYHLGCCPEVAPMSDFDMSKFLGEWYVIQKTWTRSSCLMYNFTQADKPDEYQVEQTSQHVLLQLTPVNHQYRYTGSLTVNNSSLPANMTVKFPLNPNNASYMVLSTDYNTFATIFTCQNIGFYNRQSVSILSRSKTLEKSYMDDIHKKLTEMGTRLYRLSNISQDNCKEQEEGKYLDLQIDSNTVSKAEEVLGKGIDVISDVAFEVVKKQIKDYIEVGEIVGNGVKKVVEGGN